MTFTADAGLPLSLTEQCCVFSPQGKIGSTPLMMACEKNHFEFANFLVENGADVNLQTKVCFYFCHLQSVYYVTDFLTIGPRLNITSLCQLLWPPSCGEAAA